MVHNLPKYWHTINYTLFYEKTIQYSSVEPYGHRVDVKRHQFNNPLLIGWSPPSVIFQVVTWQQQFANPLLSSIVLWQSLFLAHTLFTINDSLDHLCVIPQHIMNMLMNELIKADDGHVCFSDQKDHVSDHVDAHDENKGWREKRTTFTSNR